MSSRRLPALLLIIGAVLRVARTGAAAIWFDESNTLYRASIPFHTLFTETSENSGDLLLEIILRPLLALSHSVWMLRLPSMLAGLASLWLVWKLMERLDFTISQQILTSAIVAFLPGLLWMAQDARSYGLLACLFLAALWFALESRWLGLLAVCGLTVYSHNTGAICAGAAIAIAIYLYPWKARPILLVALGTILAWIPAILRMLDHWIIQQPWRPQVTLPWLVTSTIQALWPMLYGGWFTLATFITLVLTLLLLFSRVKAHGRIVPMLAWLLPYTGLVVFSLVVKNNMVQYRTLMPMLFPFALWLGWELGHKRKSNPVMPVLWIGMLIAGMVIWDPSERGGHLDQVADQIRSQWRTGDSLLYTTTTVGLPFDYYLGDLPHTWDDTVRSEFLLNPFTVRSEVSIPTITRSWVIYSDDPLITPAEREVLRDLAHHQQPLFTVRYVQAAQIHVYLVEEP